MLAAGIWMIAANTAAWAQERSLEYSVKAAFLTKFAAFVNWPGGGLAPGDSLRICVVGEDQVAAALARSAQATTGPHPIVVRRTPTIETGADCHVVYAAGSPRQSVGEILAAVRGAPVLTVTDASRGGERGMIHFIIFQNRVRFHVDALQASQSALGISYKLLALALSVKR